MTKIMGILNVTPDSFYDGGKHNHLEKAVQHAKILEENGADIIDIGGESSRPGAAFVPLEEEIRRVIPVIKEIRKSSTIPISVDTYKAGVAKLALDAGANIINDITGLIDPDMQNVALDNQATCIVMHMQKDPKTMQKKPFYPNGVINDLITFFNERIEVLLKRGIDKIVLDPGVGFGKTIEHNLEIIKSLTKFKSLGFPVLLGISRKSFMGNILNLDRSNLLPATIAINTIAILDKIDYIRVHDVKEHRQVTNLLSQYNQVII